MHRSPFYFLYTPNRIQFLSEEHLQIYERTLFNSNHRGSKCGRSEIHFIFFVI